MRFHCSLLHKHVLAGYQNDIRKVCCIFKSQGDEVVTNDSKMPSIVWIPVILASSTYLLYWLSINLPSLPEEDFDGDHRRVTFPSNLDELTELARLLSDYKKSHMKYLTFLYCSAYLYKQTFSIPGSIFLNLLGGVLFGVWRGFPLCCLLTAFGATNCYLMSAYFAKYQVIKYFPDKLKIVHDQVEANSDSLFFFLLFLRLFPVTPNWFMNLVAPVLNIPIHIFFLSVFIGLMPYNFICVHAGSMLSQISSMDDIFTWWTLGKLLVVANVALLPGLLLKQYHDKKMKAA